MFTMMNFLWNKFKIELSTATSPDIDPPSYFSFGKCLHFQKCEFQLQALLLVTNAKNNHFQRNFCTTTDFISTYMYCLS